MFKNSYQAGLLSVLNATGSKPLQLWSVEAGKDGSVTRVTDASTGVAALDVAGPSTATTWIACPPDRAGGLSVRLPFLDLVLKRIPGDTRGDTSIEVTVRDGAGGLRRLRASTFQASPRVTPALASLPLRLEDGGPSSGGWVRVRLDLPALLARAYSGSPPFAEVVRLRLHASVRLRCVYFADKAYGEASLPAEFRLFVRGGAGERQSPPDGAAVAVA